MELVEAEGAAVKLVEPDLLVPATNELAERSGALFVHPFDQKSVIAGQGTVGVETLDEAPDVDTILVPVGGGGLLSGILSATALRGAPARVIAVEPERAADLRDSLLAGRPTPWKRSVTATTIADGLRAPSVGRLPWEVISTWVADALTVSEASIIEAMRSISSQTGTLVEPSGAVAVAAAVTYAEWFKGQRVAAVVTGGNIAPQRFADLIARG